MSYFGNLWLSLEYPFKFLSMQEGSNVTSGYHIQNSAFAISCTTQQEDDLLPICSLEVAVDQGDQLVHEEIHFIRFDHKFIVLIQEDDLRFKPNFGNKYFNPDD